MGARHNRKRTRSRPRNRTSSDQPSHHHWHQQYSQWQDRSKAQQQVQAERERQEAMAAETQRIRIFGGETGDEVSLCAPMLQVVMGLFNVNEERCGKGTGKVLCGEQVSLTRGAAVGLA
ncbi:hypothetical protein EG328_002197 [Venturia inaequalis]|uniref:Uncharacterized protein n=1 Tax=Venturia inaequalis TaxID=5025 RepID=A0A8H3UYL5_VENIN|nr:hypothetical protein EG328_002197 [Venturia inaequalis]